MAINIKQNRESLYNSLISQGFFVDDNGNPEISLADFGEQVDDTENAATLYENLVDLGIFADAEGHPTMSLDDFMRKIHGSYSVREFYPLTENQRGLYIDWEMNRETTQYNVPALLKVSGTDAQNLRDALIAVIDCHPGLKARLAMQEGDVVQVRKDDEPAEVSLTNLDNEPDTAYFQNKVRPFDLLSDRLYRIEIIQTPTALFLFKDFHHIVFDGFSNVVFMDELKAAIKGENIVAEIFTSFDHALDEQKELEGEAFVEAESYFDKLLSSCESTVYPHSNEGTTTANLGTMEFSVASNAIDGFCRQQGMTSNSFFMTALAQLLHRATREEQVLFSTINNGRTDEAMMSITGMFVKTLPVCSVLETAKAPNTTIADQMKAMQQQLGETEKRMFYPFTRMAERHHILPQVLYVYHGRVNAEENEKVSFEEQPLSLNMVKMPLTVTIYNKTGNEYTVLLTYQPSFYSEMDMNRLGKAFCAACNSMLTAKSIAEISLLDDEERKLVESFHTSATAEVPFKLFYQPLEANAKQIPERKALVAKDRTLTFAELNAEANKVAHALMRKGVKRGDRVVLLLPRTSVVIDCMFGVSKAGGAYIPCDPEYPADRINLILNDSEAQFVITTKEHAEAYPAEKVILIDDIYGSGNAKPGDEENPNVEVSPEDLAYLIYTSGSTGRPKGVMLRHVGITNYLYDHPANIHIHGLKELDVKSYVSITTLSFDMSLKEFAGSIFNGITAVLADEQEVMDAHLLAALMKRTGAEAINGTCSRILTYMELDEFREALSHCKMVWSGGELFPKQLLTDLQKLGVRILNTYGPTEITVSSNIGDLTHAEKVTVGRPLLNYEEFIVDQFDNELPVGFVGELLIGGPGVAVGYNNLPEMTAERFVDYQGKRVYRSGDLTRWGTDGQVEIVGRNDGQVKLRGFRVELGEIEGIASKFKGIRQAVADIKKVGAAQLLCLYYTSDLEIDEEALKTFLATSLTEYMVPSAFMRIDSVPLTPNGKTNRKALPLPKMRHERCVAPANDTETTILSVVKELLDTDEIGVTTNLMTAGLNSIAAMRLSAKLLQHYNMDLRVKSIMQSPTIREMATDLTMDAPCESKRVAHPVQKYYPLTETQRGIFINWSMNPKALQYNIPHVMKFNVLDVSRMKNAIRAIAEAHPFVKCRIVAQGDDFVQVRDDDAVMPEIEVQNLDFEPDMAFFQSQVKPFDLLKDQLFRTKIFVSPTAWYMFVDIHHVISDGTSNNILARDIERAYQGEKLDKEEYTAFDLALDEQTLLQSERGEEAEKYFDQLVGGVEATVYPSSSKLDGDANYGELRVEIDGSDEIRSFCTKNAIAPSSFFLQVFHQVLHRVTREEQTLVYFISNGRSEMQLEHFFGVNVKTLPTVVSDFKSPVADSVKMLHKQMVETISNDFYPFTKMVERHGLKAEIMYNYMVDIQTKVNLNGASDTVVPLSFDTSKTPLSISIFTTENGKFECFVEYDANLYSSRDMELLGKMFCTFARNCVNPQYKLMSEVPLVNREMADRVMEVSSGKRLDIDLTQTFADLFVEQTRRTPNALAVADADSEYTYEQLDKYSDTYAHTLIDRGVKPDMFVCVMLDRTKEFPLTVLAIHKVGAAYMPLDLEYPNERLSYMIEDSESRLMITTHAILQRKTDEGGLELGNIGILYLEDLELTQETEPINLSTPENLAYVIYTSGSTGKPKGVMLHQKGLSNYIASTVDVLQITSEDRISNHRAFSFDSHIHDLYPALTVGGSIHIMPSEIRKDMRALRNFIVDHRITGGSYTTSLGAMLLEAYQLPVRFMSLGGEKMMGLVSGDVQIVNVYGPTECTDMICTHKLQKGRRYSDIPIGRPMANGHCFITDPTGNLLPMGVAGELCFAGVQVGSGYWKLPEKTSAVFVDCPFLPNDENGKPVRMYHTGDLCRWNEEGDIEFLGRIDFQVKLRGFRIELGEIENRAKDIKSIRHVVAEVKNVNGTDHLILYYTLQEGASINEEDIRNALKSSSLADYMIPDTYVPLDGMPQLPNGKTNRKALPIPEIKAAEMVPPANKLEADLLDIAATLLKTDQFGVTTNLISVGMTSLLAMRMSAAIYKQLGYEINMKNLLTDSTVRHLAELVNSGTLRKDEDREPRPVLDYYPLTENQRGVYIDWELNRGTRQYNLPSVEKMPAGTDAETLRQALLTVVNAHPYIKTRLAEREGEVVQLRLDSEPAVVDVFRIEQKPDASFFQQRVRPFDLFNDRLYRLEIYDCNGELYLFQDFHHIIFDGGSQVSFMQDVADALAGKAVESETYSAFDRAVDERELEKSEAYAAAESYFDGLMGDCEVASYPRSSQPDSKTPSAGLVTGLIDGSEIRKFCRRNDCTENSYFMAAFSEVLQRVLRRKRLLYTSITSGRVTAEMLRIMGMFVKTLPVVTCATAPDGADEGKRSVKKSVQQMQRQYIDTQDNLMFPYTKIVEKTSLRAEILFIYQGGLEAGQETAAEDAGGNEEIQLKLDVAKMPVTVVIVPRGGDFHVDVEYDASLYSARDMELLFGMMKSYSEQAAVAADKAVENIALTNNEEFNALLELGKGKHLDIDLTKTFAQLFVERAAICPDSPAVYDANSCFTYRQMDDYSNKIAHILSKNGALPNSFVCVMLDRTKEFPLTVLSIHKAGAAYTPLDIEYPNERLSYMLENSQTKVLVTTHQVLNAKQKDSEFQLDNVRVLFLDDIDYEKGDYDNTPINLTTPDNLAYMIYTSGSTGKPKGVMLHQKGLRSYIASIVDVLQITNEDRISNHRPFSFDAHIQDLYPALTVGGSIHIMPSEIRKDMTGLRDFIVNHHITGGSYTTSLGAMLLETYQLPLRYMTLTGEKMIGLVSENVQLVNGYGPTECTDLISTYMLQKGRHYTDIPIGRPMANSYCFIIDPTGNLLPAGVAGELCFASVQVGRGYWQLPEKTKEVFEDCPFLPNDENGHPVRMYHTGDLCRWNDEGNIEYLGRIDFQVKLRGFRIELGEIESRTKDIKGISQVVADVKNVNGADHLILYYTLHDGTVLEEGSILNALKSTSLAEYMIPDTYVHLDAMPLTPNGKINRKQLPMPEIKAEEIVPPENKIESDLFEIVSALLKTNQFGVTTNLISVGLTSLLAMKLSVNVYQQLGYEINTRELLTNPSIRHLVELIENGTIKKASSMRLGTSGAPSSSANDTAEKPAANNPLQKRPGNNPLNKRNDNDQDKKSNNPLLKR
ncbi:MAG: amino acid adenylation domain-containing protein [Bacteroidales bacterium]|nr:amino acid adenylation domain-containing protein [Bacteroidales bacterium]